MIVKLHDLHGFQADMHIDPQHKVSVFMKAAQDWAGLTDVRCRFLLRGLQLEVGRRLIDYEVKEGDRIHLVLGIPTYNETMSIKIMRLGCIVCIVKIKRSDTIAHVKDMIRQEGAQVPLDATILLIRSHKIYDEELEDDETAGSYCLKEDDTLHAIYKIDDRSKVVTERGSIKFKTLRGRVIEVKVQPSDEPLQVEEEVEVKGGSSKEVVKLKFGTRLSGGDARAEMDEGVVKAVESKHTRSRTIIAGPFVLGPGKGKRQAESQDGQSSTRRKMGD